MVMTDVVVDVHRLKRFHETLLNLGSSAANSPVRGAIRQWAAIYRSFIQLRFRRFSRGGGDWPPLKLSTVRSRRKGKRRSRSRKSSLAMDDSGNLVDAGIGVSILQDTGVLFDALAPEFIGAPGQYQDNIPYGIRVGFGGPASHPGSSVTIADIASYHQTGAGRLPKREILVEPDAPRLHLMARLMVDAMKKMTHGRE